MQRYKSPSEAFLAACSMALANGISVDPNEVLRWLVNSRHMTAPGVKPEKFRRQDFITRTWNRALCNLPDRALPPKDHKRFPLSDSGNSERFAHLYRDKIFFCHDTGQYFLTRGTHYEPDTTEQVIQLAKEVARSVKFDAHGVTDKKIRKAILKHAKDSESQSRKEAMIKGARSEPGMFVPQEQLDAEKTSIATPEGICNLTTGKMREARPGDYCTMITGAAPGEGKPKILLEMLNIMFTGDHDLVTFVQKGFGLSLSGITREKIFFIMEGRPDSGKTTLLNVMKRVMGTYAKSARFETFLEGKGEKTGTDLARLRGSRLVAASEPPKGTVLDAATINRITGQDSIVCRFLRENQFEYNADFKLWLACNNKPEPPRNEPGFWRRVKIIPVSGVLPPEWLEQFGQVDLVDALMKEAPQILSWAIEGFLLWQKEGIRPPKAVLDANRDYRNEDDTIGQFLLDYTTEDPDGYYPCDEFREAVNKYCQQHKWEQMSKRQIGDEMTARGFKSKPKKIQGQTKRVYFGIRRVKTEDLSKPQLSVVGGGNR